MILEHRENNTRTTPNVSPNESDNEPARSEGINDYIIVNNDESPSAESRSELIMNGDRKIVRFEIVGKVRPNPLKVIKELRAALKREQVIISSGHFSISVVYNSETERELLCRIKYLDECQVRASSQTPEPKNEVRVVITGVPTSLEPEIIVDYSKCKSAYRITRTEGGKTFPTTAVVLTYEKNETPEIVRIEYLSFRPKPYIRAPTRCFRCNSYGHIVKHCLKKPKCGRCSGDHTIWECPTPERLPSACASCRSLSHITGDNECPQKIRARELSKMVSHGLTYAQAAKTLDRPAARTVRPTVPGITTGKREEEQATPKNENLLEQLERNIAPRMSLASKELQGMIDESNSRLKHISDLVTNMAIKLADLTRRVENIELAQEKQEEKTTVNIGNNLKVCKMNQLAAIETFEEIASVLYRMTDAAAFSKGTRDDRNRYYEASTDLFNVGSGVMRAKRLCDPDAKHEAAQAPKDTQTTTKKAGQMR